MTRPQRAVGVLAVPAALAGLVLAVAAGTASAAAGKAPMAVPRHVTVFVANRGSGTVSPIFTATNRAGKMIRTGRLPQAIAITPDYTMAYVANGVSSRHYRQIMTTQD
jgi:YVTN family beta-propeller protein